MMINMKRMLWVLAVLGFVLGFSGFVFAADAGGVEKININTASAVELTHLKGVGPKLAERIVAYRKANGPFKTVEDLDMVKGVGPKILKANAAMLTVGAPAKSAPPKAPVPTPKP
ncbi:MAG: helix-hairpin-helix domain-containing protein [Desulfobacteraceae bacterium]|nr:helix-hairpin-helix domain-containing protein [Desulfobacteraceae bacterium]